MALHRRRIFSHRVRLFPLSNFVLRKRRANIRFDVEFSPANSENIVIKYQMPSTSKSVTFHTYTKALAIFSASNFFSLPWKFGCRIFCFCSGALIDIPIQRQWWTVYISLSFKSHGSAIFACRASLCWFKLRFYSQNTHIVPSRSLSLARSLDFFLSTDALKHSNVAFDMAYIFTLHWIFQSTIQTNLFYLFILFALFFSSLLIFRICCWSLRCKGFSHF